MSIKITAMETQLFHIPLETVLVDSLHGNHTHFDLITVTLTADNGMKGTGYTYTGGRGGYGISCMLKYDMAKYIVGKEVEKPEDLKYQLEKTFHYVGRGGVLSFAISAVDIASWDIFTKMAGKTLYQYFGKERQPVKTYYGGIDLGYTEEELLDNIKSQMEKGHNAIKIKVGKDNPDEDISRMRAVRKYLGPDKVFMIDANMVWDLKTAKKMADEAYRLGIYWIEEPMNPDRLFDYQELADYSKVPLAMGENLHIFYEHVRAVKIGKIKYLEPDAANICGITGWLQVADYAKENGLTVSSHGMQELHVNLLNSVDNPGYMEYHSFPIHDYTTYKLEIHDGTILPDDKPGVGVTFNWDKLSPFKTII